MGPCSLPLSAERVLLTGALLLAANVCSRPQGLGRNVEPQGSRLGIGQSYLSSLMLGACFGGTPVLQKQGTVFQFSVGLPLGSRTKVVRSLLVDLSCICAYEAISLACGPFSVLSWGPISAPPLQEPSYLCYSPPHTCNPASASPLHPQHRLGWIRGPGYQAEKLPLLTLPSGHKGWLL